MSQNVIELNGKRYDALTGAFMGKSDAPAAHTATPRRAGSSGRVIDGFIRGAQPAKKKVTHHVPAAAKAAHAVTRHAPKTSPSRKAIKSISPALVKAAGKKAAPAEMHAEVTAVQHHAGHQHIHEKAKDAARHQPEHAKTLMRSVVHKPEVQMKPAIRPQAPAEVAARPASSLMAKRSAASIDPTRQERARAALKHAAVQRFNAGQPGLTPAHHTRHAKEAVPVIAVHPQPLSTYSQASAAHGVHSDIFEHAMKHARSHEQLPFKKRRIRHSRAFNVMAGIAAFLILGGFIAYLNMPNIQLHVASVEAGFHASMPAYKPTGYALKGSVKHDGGTVSMSFASGDSSFRITQQSSNWDSQALLDNTLALSGPHRTIERNGRIIFVYSNNDGANAAWVTGNVRYDITGDASLSANQLADIAASM